VLCYSSRLSTEYYRWVGVLWHEHISHYSIGLIDSGTTADGTPTNIAAGATTDDTTTTATAAATTTIACALATRSSDM
jgi:hypothetical protein